MAHSKCGPFYCYNKELFMFKNIIKIMCLLSVIGTAENLHAQINQESNTVEAEFPTELETTWEFDEAASIEYAKRSVYWNDNIAKLLPKLIATNKQIKYRFNENELVSVLEDTKQKIAITLNKQTLTTYLFNFQHDDKQGHLKVEKAAGGRINIQAEGLLGYQFLLWKKRRERLTGV